MNKEFVLQEYYKRYLREVRGLTESSVKHYAGAMGTISDFLCKRGKIEKSVYEIVNLGELEKIKDYLESDSEFIEMNNRGNRMYRSGFNNYFLFAKGEGFEGIEQNIALFDIELPALQPVARSSEGWRRSTIIKEQVVKAVDYKCEIDISHHTFIAKSTGHQYMEGHHAIPMRNQSYFGNSLDVYANVVCLCPTCHRMLHYGMDSERVHLLNQIYCDRIDRMANSGIAISKDTFVEMAL